MWTSEHDTAKAREKFRWFPGNPDPVLWDEQDDRDMRTDLQVPEEYRLYRGGNPKSGDWTPDIRRIGLGDAKLLVSRKRTTNMFDIMSIWKRSVLEKVDERVLETATAAPPPPSLDFEEPVISEKRARSPDSSDSDIIRPHRRSSPVSRNWKIAEW